MRRKQSLDLTAFLDEPVTVMTARGLFSKVAVSATILSLAVTPDMAAACSIVLSVEEGPKNHMRRKCRVALVDPRKFLAKVKAGKIDQSELGDYVLGFDEGKFGCKKDNKFVFRILGSYYSVAERKLSVPRLLQRYSSNWPDNHAPAERQYLSGLLWLHTDTAAYLPNGWTAEQARAFLEKPEHWPVAVPKFGRSADRDELLFASVSDPKGAHFDRELSFKFAVWPDWVPRSSLETRQQRKIIAASLFADPQYGAIDLARAESMLPISALYDNQNSNPLRQRAKSIWIQIADAYVQSDNPALHERGLQLREKMSPPTLDKWPTIEHPKDGRIWLSLANWPKSIKNPFASARIGQQLMVAADYPSRALRNEETGSVTLAARFGPDGKFAELEVIQPSGSALLDQASVQIINRRFRPKLADLALEGFQGKEVRVPLLVVDWQMSDAENDNEGVSHYANGTLTVVATPRIYRTDGGGCGFPPSIFL